MSAHMNLLVPQWQGGGRNLATHKGGCEIKDIFLPSAEVVAVDVSTRAISGIKNNIIGYDEIAQQLSRARSEIDKERPKTIFTIGGGCDSDIVSISFLNEVYSGDMTLMYFDAHGDLNTPESSPTKRFYGMSLRTLLGDGDRAIKELMFSTLEPSQLIMLGTRRLDKEEARYIESSSVDVLTVDQIEEDAGQVTEMVRAKGHSNVYIHIDLDVLEPTSFPHSEVPIPGGLQGDTLVNLVKKLSQEFRVVGLGLLEYTASGEKNAVIEELVRMGTQLKAE